MSTSIGAIEAPDGNVVLFPDRLKYESQRSKSNSVALGGDLGFPSSVPGNLAFLQEDLWGIGVHPLLCIIVVSGKGEDTNGGSGPELLSRLGGMICP